MKATGISVIKKELSQLSKPELLEVCLSLAKYKKENKELLSYLLFQSHNEATFVAELKSEMDVMFSEINKSNVYFSKKSLRRILRIIQKHIKFSGSAQTEAEVLIYYCSKLNSSGIAYKKHKVLQNLYDRLVLRIEKSIGSLHEDLQYDLKFDLANLKS
jgi:hypothetical protein